MAGIYIHIPFCRKACHYCNFHFTTSLRYKNELIASLLKEIELVNVFNEPVETIYFGGGTPGLCSIEEIGSIIQSIYRKFSVAEEPEITLEANPENLTDQNLRDWKHAGINRLSIGVQSFFDEDLQWMNRSHSAQQAIDGLEKAIYYFSNITMDLIYGGPTLSDEHWGKNMQQAIDLKIPHLSCYALTVEPHTRLNKLIHEGKVASVDMDKQARHFLMLMERMAIAGYEHYEISNFARPGFYSRHNTAYWNGKPYIGLGPSAHSYDGNARWWNVANNIQYIRSIQKRELPIEKEILTPIQKKNESIMLNLRLRQGLRLNLFSAIDQQIIQKKITPYIKNGKAILQKNAITLTQEGKLLADGIAASLFFDEPK